MSTHCQAMSDWFELSIRHSVIYDEIIMTYHIHGWSPLCSTKQGQATDIQPLVSLSYWKTPYHVSIFY